MGFLQQGQSTAFHTSISSAALPFLVTKRRAWRHINTNFFIPPPLYTFKWNSPNWFFSWNMRWIVSFLLTMGTVLKHFAAIHINKPFRVFRFLAQKRDDTWNNVTITGDKSKTKWIESFNECNMWIFVKLLYKSFCQVSSGSHNFQRDDVSGDLQSCWHQLQRTKCHHKIDSFFVMGTVTCKVV